MKQILFTFKEKTSKTMSNHTRMDRSHASHINFLVASELYWYCCYACSVDNGFSRITTLNELKKNKEHDHEMNGACFSK